MNKIKKPSKNIIAQSNLQKVIANSFFISMLTIGTIALPTRAGTVKYDIWGGKGAGDCYNGIWTFDVTLDTSVTPNKLNFKILTTNGATCSDGSMNDDYINVVYMYEAELVEGTDNKYQFHDSDEGMPPPDSDYDLTMSGMYFSDTHRLMLNNPVISKRKDGTGEPIPFIFKPVPEPSSVLSLLSVSLLGIASILKQKIKL